MSSTCSQQRGVLARLKKETAAQHQRLEAKLDILRPDFTLSEYTDFLARMYGFYRRWQETAYPTLQEFAPSLVTGRDKLPLLVEDLRFLGQSPEALPLPRTLPTLGSLPETLGSLYVLEGSTLGGQILCRHFAKTLGLGPDGLRYLHGYGERTGTMWRSFCESLPNHVTTSDEDSVIFSAQYTFDTLSCWLAGEERT